MTAELAPPPVPGATPCEACNGGGQIGQGISCPVCGGTGVASAEQVAAWRGRLYDAAVRSAVARLEAAGDNAALGWLREQAQARQDAQQAARRATEAADRAVSGVVVPMARVEAATARAEAAASRAETAATQTAEAAQAAITTFAPDPTDPPPGAPIPPGFGAGDVFYLDSLLVRQLDVWGALSTVGSGGLLTNPMTALGDLITGGIAGAAQRLGIGGTGQVLTVVGGAPAWANNPAGFTNPMTALGDLIEGGTAGAAQRLAAGTAGQVLTMVSGAPAWAASAAGFSNPMTAAGDIITGGTAGAPQRLGAGAIGQVLSTQAGSVLAWINSPSGFTNPMTAPGDLIDGGTAGIAQRLAAGTAGQVLTMVSGAPAWAAPSTNPGTIVVAPSGDTGGSTDIININNAFTALAGEGTVSLVPGATYYINATGITIPPFVNMTGSGTVINCVGSGNSTYVMVRNTANPSTYTRQSGQITGIIIDGTGAGATAIGLQYQDMNGFTARVAIRNFTGTSAIGIQLANNLFSLNQMTGNVRLENNTNHLVFNALGSQTAIEHIYTYWSIASGPGQNPITLLASVGVQGSFMIGSISSDPAGGPVFTFNAGCVFSDTMFAMKTEQTTASTSSSTVSFAGAGTGFQRCVGILWFSTNINNSNIATAHGLVKFLGQVSGDPTLFNLPTGTASGTTFNNTGVPCLVSIYGGTVTAIVINGVTITGATSGTFYIPPTGTYQFTYTGSPTISFTNAVAT